LEFERFFCIIVYYFATSNTAAEELGKCLVVHKGKLMLGFPARISLASVYVVVQTVYIATTISIKY